MLKQWIKAWLLRHDIILSRPPGQFVALQQRLESLRKRGLRIKCAVDGGAACGGWLEQFKLIYPESTVLCIEPRDDASQILQNVAKRWPDVVLAKTLIGPRNGQVSFHVYGDQSSVIADARGADFGVTTTAPMTTLDDLIVRTKVPQPDLIKLDLQGYELDALRGATRCLALAQILLLELSFFRFQQGQPLAEEVIDFVHKHGFRLHDIAGLWQRPLDGATSQGDFIFVRENHPLLQDDRWDAQQTFQATP